MADGVVLRERDGVVARVAVIPGGGYAVAVVGGLVQQDPDGGLSRVDLPS